MPYTWSHDISKISAIDAGIRHANGDAPALTLNLTTHNSLTPRGFVNFFGLTAFLMCIPLLAFLGSYFLWVIFAFLAAAFLMTWLALKASWRRGRVSEMLTIWPDNLRLTHIASNGRTQNFEVNPYWARLELVKDGGPVPNYLTISGSGRTVELGAFLSEPERVCLHEELENLMPKIIQAGL